MSSFTLNKEKSAELQAFPYIIEFERVKNSSMKHRCFEVEKVKYFSIYFFLEGKFEWMVNDAMQHFFPNDVLIAKPNETLGNREGMLEVGLFYKLSLEIENFDEDDDFTFGKWTKLAESDMKIICKLLALKKPLILQDFRKGIELFQSLEYELMNEEIGYIVRVNSIIEEMIIKSARAVSKQESHRFDFQKMFQKLDLMLRENLSHHWTVGEMAGVVGLGNTAFTEKLKYYSGFSPLNYLINLRISESIRLLKTTNISMTEIALETGFYSSQHFSTTFKKLTGYSPKIYRKNSL
ncbi:helix-turn-helix domain-containing protein [Emticicia sp. CRIBPO]|uniref:helix-turn-helix transcriptional regulator n=1 Tax=Emticicia sp. CRIBPO TaxID=2683258 RepID=UPI001412304B|nr:AraC family transcriptional regulator [Emticicia sp. CRIBPO]NBA87675.1 helix-turn-helix domain-containing protein [Emticicia sp. CRIBPO]